MSTSNIMSDVMGGDASVIFLGVTTNTGNTYTTTSPPALVLGKLYTAKFNAANTGATTLNGINVYKNGAALTGSEIAASAMIALTYDGTQLNMTGDGSGSGGGGGGASLFTIRAIAALGAF